ncbi:hypothetical protein RHMOL_Rhmol10G0042100 [Rhododendron molle]|uniref:Uncharacterized protein n=1 Tax=Rhododendron molle TaxID=49168 RepID=A0ACC0LZZ4_RHOML|nr:hypothetical protein RHMOL_Rhmol10G0042100 [Rhododendron molle]
MLRRLLLQASATRRRCLFTPHSSSLFQQRSSSSSSSSTSHSQIETTSTSAEHVEDSNPSPQPSSSISVDRSGLYNPPEHGHGPSSDSELVKHLKGIIKFRGGPISVAEYMEEVLTNPKAGFYINRDVFGAEGDFITSPEVSQMFGEMIGVWAMSLWEQMGRPNRVNLVELGPGRGTLMADLLRGASKFKNFTESLNVHMVECSPTLQKLQYGHLKCIDEDSSDVSVEKRTISTLSRTPVSWHATLEQVPAGLPTIIIAHEFFDALPVHQFQRASRGWCEKMIDVAEDSSFNFVLSPRPTPATLFLMKRCKWAAAEEIAKVGQIEAIRKHKFVDILDNPGTADLSAYVDFASIRHAAEEVSEDVSVHGPITQSQFLGSLGINFRFEALLENCKTDEQEESLMTGYWQLVGEGEAQFWEGPEEKTPIGMGTRYMAMAIVNKKQGIPVPFQ